MEKCIILVDRQRSFEIFTVMVDFLKLSLNIKIFETLQNNKGVIRGESLVLTEKKNTLMHTLSQ